MRERWIVGLVVLYFAILLVGSLFIGLTTLSAFEKQSSILRGNQSQHPYNWTNPNARRNVRNVTVFTESNAHYTGAYKPNVSISGIIAQDYHAITGSKVGNLYLDGNLTNTGNGTAYELRLHVIAMNAEGKAIDTSIDSGGITPHMNLGINRQINYNGSALVSCNITLYYLDAVDAQNRPRP